MFGWEFPPHIAGGLGTACYGMTRGLARNGVDVTFIVPHAYGDEDQRFTHVVNASDVEALYGSTGSGADDILEKMSFIHIDSNMVPYISPEEYESYHEQYVKSGRKTWSTTDAWKQRYTFSGKYGANLMEEVARYAVVAAQVARDLEGQFDVIHAHDWLTYYAGIAAKRVSGKPLVVHMHATEYDRSGENVNTQVYAIERAGMHAADRVIAVSNLTRNIVINRYGVPAEKIVTVHNAVRFAQNSGKVPERGVTDKVVTFLGRITYQKGPDYFVEAAAKVLKRVPDVRFVMAGSGDMMNHVIRRVARLGIADRFHFTGFLRGEDVHKMFQLSDVYVMPSVSEPFGISPLEAMRSNVPVIISKQSGVAEVLDYAVKVDYWDVDALADAIYGLIKYPALSGMFASKGLEEVTNLKWNDAAAKIKDHNYLDDLMNRSIMQKVARQCYLPMNALLLKLIRENKGKFRCSFSITGIAIEQFRAFAPEVLDSFKELAATGCVEFLAETYSHSLASLASKEDFTEQVKLHTNLIKKEFGVKPTAFRNTELIYSDEIGAMVAGMGFRTMLAEGAKHVLGWKSPNYVYANAIDQKLRLLLRNYKLSDDIAFRFSNKSWDQWPLTADKYVQWLASDETPGEVINLFMDYETFGEHQNADTGIFEFMRALPKAILARKNGLEFATVTEAAKKHQPVAVLHCPHVMSWADEERDVTAWLGNELQNEAFSKLYAQKEKVAALKNPDFDYVWSFMQTSDHFYYMATKWLSDGDVHSYFNPYDSAYDAFINYMNVLSDFIIELDKAVAAKAAKKRA